jgi:hypothetical protein
MGHLAQKLEFAVELFGFGTSCSAEERVPHHRDSICFASWGKEKDSYSFYYENTRLCQVNYSNAGEFSKLSFFPSSLPPAPAQHSPSLLTRVSFLSRRLQMPSPGMTVVKGNEKTLSISSIIF